MSLPVRFAKALRRIRYSAFDPVPSILRALYKDPYDETSQSALADALLELDGDHPVGKALQERIVNGETRSNNWHSLVDRGMGEDYTGDVHLGSDRHFNYYLGAEGQLRQTPRVVLHAVSRGRQVHLAFEYPPEELAPDFVERLRDKITPSEHFGAPEEDATFHVPTLHDNLRAYRHRAYRDISDQVDHETE
jgi:hypothetical protein